LDPDAGGAYSPLERAVRAQEDLIRHDSVESLYAFDVGGSIVFSKTGGQHDIQVSLLEVARLRDTVLTHNHPNGTSLSRHDLQVAAVGDLAEIRVVTADWRFSLRRPPDGWDLRYFRHLIEPAYHRLWEEVLQELLLAVNDDRIPGADAAALHLHEVWVRIASELGLQYRREA
jgi:hypothetical protein